MRKGVTVIVSEITKALSAMPQDASILGVFVTRIGLMSEGRMQEYKVVIASKSPEGIEHAARFNYVTHVPERREEKPLTQKPFAGIKKLFS